MLGAACLTSLAAMRAGAGLVTAAIPKGLNIALQGKIEHVVMTLPLPQTKNMTFAACAATIVLKSIQTFTSMAIGPGLSLDPSTLRFAQHLIKDCSLPMVVDADALNALENKTNILLKAKGPRILTPHTGEMARLSGLTPATIDADRRHAVSVFARRYHCILILKGHHTLVAAPNGKIYTNKTGNPGMATAGSGDVLTGMVAALLAQRATPFEAARLAVEWHGKAGDAAARIYTKTCMIATDIIEAMTKCYRQPKYCSG